MVDLYAFGSNELGQLGVGHHNDLSQPEKCLFINEDSNSLWDSISIAFGGNHTILVNKSTGTAYGTGENGAHQLGLNNVSRINKFSALCSEYGERKWALAAAMWEASVLVDSEGYVFTSGIGPFGELGKNPVIKEAGQKTVAHETFTQVENTKLSSPAMKAYSGLRHVVILCENGDVWGWGANRKGQINQNFSTEHVVWQPQQIAAGILDIGCGKDFTVMLTKDNRIHFYGNKQRFDEKLDIFIQNHNMSTDSTESLSIAVGWSSIHVTVNKPSGQQQVYAFGSNMHKQLYPLNVGFGKANNHKLLSMAAGTEHYLATERNISDSSLEILSWGWGEHGNCGPAYEESQQALYTISSHPESTVKAIDVYAGYASSWFNLVR